MSRKSIKVHDKVKQQLEHIKAELGFKSESETIDYLINAYMLHLKDKITLTDHKNLLLVVEGDHGKSMII